MEVKVYSNYLLTHPFEKCHLVRENAKFLKKTVHFYITEMYNDVFIVPKPQVLKLTFDLKGNRKT